MPVMKPSLAPFWTGVILLFAVLVYCRSQGVARAQQASPAQIEIEIARVQLQHVQRAFADELRAQAAAYEARLKTAMEWLQAAQAKETK